jgi:hypothetical protein
MSDVVDRNPKLTTLKGLASPSVVADAVAAATRNSPVSKPVADDIGSIMPKTQ